jgi:hypothetical protein
LFTLACQYDGAGWIEDGLRCCFGKVEVFPDCLQAIVTPGGKHYGKWFVRPVLSAAQALHGLVIGCIADEVIAPNTLDRNNQAGMKRFDRMQERTRYVGVFTFVLGVFTYAYELQLGAAFVTGQGLSVETAVTGGFVLCPAVIAQRKPGH